MQILITNGTLTQVQETLSASSPYILPSTITVTGATSSYNNITGVVTLTSPTSNISVTASAKIGVDITTLANYDSVTAGQHALKIKAQAVSWFDSNLSTALTFTKLAAPSGESISGSNYTISAVENAEQYQIIAIDTTTLQEYVLGVYNAYSYAVEDGVVTIHNAPYTANNEGVITIQ